MKADFEPIPSHFFEKGEYEVWAAKSHNYDAPVVRIAQGLCLKTAKAYDWPKKEIRLNGKKVEQ